MNSIGYGNRMGPTGLDIPLGALPYQDAIAGLHLTAVGLASVAAITRFATNNDQTTRVAASQD